MLLNVSIKVAHLKGLQATSPPSGGKTQAAINTDQEGQNKNVATVGEENIQLIFQAQSLLNPHFTTLNALS